MGVVFDQGLTFHDHISGICKSTHFNIHNIGRIQNLLPVDATAQLIYSLALVYLLLSYSTFVNDGLDSGL